MSKDLCDNNMSNIWQMSQILLPVALNEVTCVITQKSTKQPKLMVLGGRTKIEDTHPETDHCIQYFLCDIIGNDTFNRFMIDVTQVMLCVIFFSSVFVCLKQKHLTNINTKKHIKKNMQFQKILRRMNENQFISKDVCQLIFKYF